MIPACLPPRDVSRPKVPPPLNACDTHAHVFGPSTRFPYADDRSYTPPDPPLVIDHMGRTDARAGTGTPGFQSLRRAVGEGWCWAKLSGAHRLSRAAPDYPDARPFHEALVRANPERLVWGGDWPHPRVEGEMPDAGHLFELFRTWTLDQAIQHRILVANAAKLYDFPN
jgi:predicted TIM-barrel fold metal-dependent hydrolase